MSYKLLTIFFVVLLSFISGCTTEEQQAEEPLRPVRTITVDNSAGPQVRVFTGTSKAGIESNLSFRVDGTLVRLSAAVGDFVKKGTVLAELDAKDYVLKLQEAQASLDRALAEERNAKANYDRIRALYENRNASLNELDSARAAYESARAAVRSIQNQLELAKSQVAYTKLESPADCTVAAVRAELNENVASGHAVFTVVCGKQAEVKVSVPEVFITSISKGESVVVRFDVIKGVDFDATVSEVGVASSDFSTTYPVVVTLAEVDERIRSGMAAEVLFELAGNSSNAIVVPAVAVMEDTKGRYVYVVQEKTKGVGVVQRRVVTIGDINSAGIEILSGLENGERVVTAGVSQLKDGQQVKL